MPTIDKIVHPNGKITYRARVRLKGMPWKSKTCKTKTDAKIWGQKTESELREGINSPTSQFRKKTCGELIDRYILEVLPKKPKIAKARKMQLTWWKNQIGNYLLSELTPPLLIEQREKLLSYKGRNGSSRSTATCNRYIASMSHAMTIAMKEWQWVKENPFFQISRPKEPKCRENFLTKSQISDLLESCEASRNHSLYTIVKLLICTGLRKSELLSLKYSDISWDEKRITIQETKNSERHSLPMSEMVYQLLNNHRILNEGKGSAYVFPSKDNKRPADIRAAWDQAVARAKIDCTLHDLRRTCATLLSSDHCSPLVIGNILNHKTLAMVRRYSRNNEDAVHEALNSMNDKLFGKL